MHLLVPIFIYKLQEKSLKIFFTLKQHDLYLRYCQRTYLKYSIHYFVNYTIDTYYTIVNEALLKSTFEIDKYILYI